MDHKLWQTLGVHKLFAALLCTLATIAGGCSSLEHLRGENFSDDSVRLGQQIRPAGEDEGKLSGFSTKSRQIEKDLGYR